MVAWLILFFRKAKEVTHSVLIGYTKGYRERWAEPSYIDSVVSMTNLPVYKSEVEHLVKMLKRVATKSGSKGELNGILKATGLVEDHLFVIGDKAKGIKALNERS